MLRPGLSGPFYFSLYELKIAICRQSNLLFCILRGILYNLVNVVLVAQLDRASASGAEGRGFDSRRAYHFFILPQRLCLLFYIAILIPAVLTDKKRRRNDCIHSGVRQIKLNFSSARLSTYVQLVHA